MLASGFAIPASLFGAQPRSVIRTFWSDVLLGTLRGRVSMRAGGKFPPSLRLVRLNFTGSAGLWVMHSRLFIRYATRDVSLPFGDQTSSLRPSGVLYRLGCGSNFLPSLCYWVRHTLQEVPASGFGPPASASGAQLGSKFSSGNILLP